MQNWGLFGASQIAHWLLVWKEESRDAPGSWVGKGAGNDTIIYVQGPGSPSLVREGGGDNEFNLADLIISFFMNSANISGGSIKRLAQSWAPRKHSQGERSLP